MKVAFWSIQRASGWNTENAATRNMLGKTHRNGGVIDYAYYKGGTCNAYSPIAKDRSDWDVIDHTPIGMEITA